ncbi:type 1 glutamine amidotransferase [Georgenia sp. 10Sc9-8]|uniref:Type 1 glutamine amidotransferase n=1 Tax=Georgenia halotolerans TaxID=3028317 RepID=A0ABT5TW94_9MICO|nr:type 1 glutamine amidotransferase [Georgenia halotolerans]
MPLDRLGPWLAGLRLRVLRPWDGDPVPPRATEVGGGLLVLGGVMSALDDHLAPWLPATKQLVRDVVESGVPMLGVCLGHQLLAEATGGEVTVAAPAGREAGVVEITWCPEAADDPVLAGAVRAAGARAGNGSSGTATAWMPSMHADAVTRLPPGAVHLAGSAQYPVQAMRLGTALGVQFHPEASPELLAGWARAEGLDAEEVAARARARDADVAAVGRAIATGFAAQVRGPRLVPGRERLHAQP